MSTLTKENMEKIADLAKLTFAPDKLQALTHDLDNILKLVNKMDQAKTENIPPLAHPLNVTQPLRDDVVTEENQRDLFQKNAPRVEAGLYIVNKFVEE